MTRGSNPCPDNKLRFKRTSPAISRRGFVPEIRNDLQLIVCTAVSSWRSQAVVRCFFATFHRVSMRLYVDPDVKPAAKTEEEGGTTKRASCSFVMKPGFVGVWRTIETVRRANNFMSCDSAAYAWNSCVRSTMKISTPKSSSRIVVRVAGGSCLKSYNFAATDAPSGGSNLRPSQPEHLGGCYFGNGRIGKTWLSRKLQGLWDCQGPNTPFGTRVKCSF